MRYFLILAFVWVISSSDRSSDNTGDRGACAWCKVLDNAAWSKSYNFQMFSIRDTLRVFHPDGAWYSVNGRDWVKSQLTDVIHNQAFLDYIYFKNAVYGLGYFKGNIERFTFKPEIYRTTDLKSWKTISTQSNLPHRFFYHPFVFKNKIWIIGGEDRQTQYADIWNSEDGVHWTKQKDKLPFGKRSNSRVVWLNGRLYLLNNDVWSSSDGLNWQKVTAEIVPGEQVFGYQAVVFNNQIWLLGCNRNGKFNSRVLVSKDGKTWREQEAPWSPRGGIAAAVHRNKIFMTGGKYGGLMKGGAATEFVYSNDVWALGIKR